MCVCVKYDIFEDQAGNGSGSCLVTELHGNSGQELLCMKGFCHVVCGSFEQQIYFIVHIGLCAHNNDRDTSYQREYVLAVKSRQH